MASNIFERATRNKTRFTPPTGGPGISVEQLWDLPLEHARVTSIESLGNEVTRKLTETQEASFVNKGKTTKARTDLQLQLDILTHVRDYKLAQKEAAEKRVDIVMRRQRIKEILAAKDDSVLMDKSREDLQKELADLDTEAGEI